LSSVSGRTARVLDSFTATPVRVSAILRLPLIGLIVVLVSLWEVEHWLPQAYALILGIYVAAAVVWMVLMLRGPMPPWADWVNIGIDVSVALCIVSGGATIALLPVFFILPISVAFQDRPLLTAVVGAVIAFGYRSLDRLFETR
jgi:two-component system NarL family sensor kinase